MNTHQQANKLNNIIIKQMNKQIKNKQTNKQLESNVECHFFFGRALFEFASMAATLKDVNISDPNVFGFFMHSISLILCCISFLFFSFLLFYVNLIYDNLI
jgi:hypothetical protein